MNLSSMNFSKTFLNPLILLTFATSCGNEFPTVLCERDFPFVCLNWLPNRSTEHCLVHVMKSSEQIFLSHLLTIEEFLNFCCSPSVVSFCSEMVIVYVVSSYRKAAPYLDSGFF